MILRFLLHALWHKVLYWMTDVPSLLSNVLNHFISVWIVGVGTYKIVILWLGVSIYEKYEIACYKGYNLLKIY